MLPEKLVVTPLLNIFAALYVKIKAIPLRYAGAKGKRKYIPYCFLT
jgi:hypothetical protein